MVSGLSSLPAALRLGLRGGSWVASTCEVVSCGVGAVASGDAAGLVTELMVA
jgi:hypothetical protein